MSFLDSKPMKYSSDLQWDSLEIPVKWGTLRGKRLRRLNNNATDSMHPIMRVLAIHGWLDNCNSFDVLVNFLPSHLDFVTLDLPGHGLSDHLPFGARYDQITYVYSIKDAAKHLQWNSFIYVGHSMGAAIGHLVTGLFPKLIKCFISLDYIGYKGILGNPSVAGVRNEALEFYRLQNIIPNPPFYTKLEALKRFMSSRVYANTSEPFIDEDAAKVLIERAIMPVQNLDGIYTWRHDQRAKIRWFNIIGYQSMYELVSNLECPILLIRANEGVYKNIGSSELNEDNLISAYSEKCKMFQYVKVSGNHYPHLGNAKEVSLVINSFIEKLSQPVMSKL